MRLCATRRKAVGSIIYIKVAQLNEALRYKMEGVGSITYITKVQLMRHCATRQKAVGSITYITVAQLDEALRYKTEGRGFDYLH